MRAHRSLRASLLAATALTAALLPQTSRAAIDLVITGGTTVDLSGSDVFYTNLFLDDGTLTNGTLDATTLFDLRRGFVDANLTGTADLLKTTGNTISLSGTNTYLGATTISDGTLIVSGGFALPDATSLLVNSPGILQLNASETVGHLSGSGTVLVNSGYFFTTGGDNQSSTFTGQITGNGGLVKQGSGIFVLTGANDYLGGTTISGGTVRLTGTGQLGAFGSDVTIQSGGTLDITGTNQFVGALTLTGNAVVTGTIFFPDPHAFLTADSVVATVGAGQTAAIDVDLRTFGTITKNGLGTLRLGGFPNNFITGPIDVNAGTLQLIWQNSPGAAAINLFGETTLSLNNGVGNGQNFYNPVTLAGSGVSIDVAENVSVQWGAIGETGGSNGFTKTGGGNLALAGDSTFTGTTTIQQGSITLGWAGSSTGSVAGPIDLAAGTGLGFWRSGTVTLPGNISGDGYISLDPSNSATVTLSGNNTYTGSTFVDGGTLVASGGNAISDSGTLFVGAAGSVHIDNNESIGALSGDGSIQLNAFLSLDAGTYSAYDGVMSGIGGVNVSNVGQLTLSKVQTYTGLTTITDSQIVLDGLANIAGNVNVLGADSTLTFLGTGTNTRVYNGVLSGNGNLKINVGATVFPNIGNIGFVQLTGANTLTGLTTIEKGRLQIVGNGSFAGDVFVAGFNDTAWLDFMPNGTLTYSGSISGQDVAMQSAGTTILTGANTHSYNGIGEGTLKIGGSGTLGNSGVVIGLSGFGAGAVLDLGGTTQQISTIRTFDGTINSVVNGTLNASGFYNFDNGTISANLAGSATLNKTSGGTATLSGSNTYSGLTNIHDGTIVAQGGNAISDASIVSLLGSGSVLQLDDDETIGGIDGAEGLIDLGANALTFGANNTNSATGVAILGTASSSLVKVGSGVADFSNGLGHLGTTIVNAGEINVNGNVAGSVIVNLGGRYSGTSTIAGNLSVLGTLATGNSPGTTTVLGNFTGGGILDVEVQFDNAGSPVNGTTHDFLDIAGNVLGSPTSINLLTYAPSGSPAATTGNGIQLVRVGGITSAADFTMSSYLLGSYFYDLTYIADYSGTDDGFFLQSSLATPGCSVTTGNDACFIDSTTNQATPVDALAGNDTLQLTGSTNFNFDVSTIGTVYTNFEVYQKADTSIVTLTGLAGLTTLGFDVQNGTLIAGTGQLGALGANNILTPGVLEIASNLTTGSIAGSGSVVLNADLTTGANNASTTFGGDISGVGGLTKTGTGVFTLSGNNSFTGDTTVAGGTLTLAGGNAISDSSHVSISSGTLALSASETIGSLSGVGGTFVNLGANTLTAGGDNTSTTFGGVISGSGQFHKEGAGTMTLSGANTLTGTMSLDQGGLTIAGAGTLGASTVNLFVQGTLDLGTTAQTVGSLGMSAGSIQNGSLTVNGNAFAQVGTISADLTVTGSFDKAFGGGSLTLSGTNTLSSVGIGSGTLIAANDAALTDSASVNMSYIGFGIGPRLQINTNQTIGSVGGDLFSSVDLGANVLTTGGNNASTNLAGIVFGTGGLTKVGTGTFTLTGSNTYTGGTTISGGTLQLSGSGRAGAVGSNISIADGAALDVTSTNQTVGTVTLTDNARVTSSFGIMGLFDFGQLNVGTSAGATAEISVPMQGGTISKSGAGKLLVSGALNGGFTGTVNLDAGTLQLYWQDALGTGNLNINGPSTLSLNNLLGLGNSQAFSNTITLAGAGATIDVNSNFSILNGAIGETSGSWGFTKTGSGMLHLGGVNTFSGGIDILHGGIRLLNSNAAGTGPITTFGSVISYANAVNNAAPIIVNSNTTQLEVLAADAATQSGVISEIGGPRPIEKIGTGTLTLTGANTYTGLTTITGGTLVAQGGSAIANTAGVTTGSAGTFALNTSETIGSFAGSGSLLLGSGTVLTTGGDNSSTSFSGTSSGAGGLTKTGSGVFQLTGANAFTGPLSVAAGNLSIVSGGSLSGASAFSVLTGAQAFLGGTVQGVNGSGMTGTGIGPMSVSSGGTVYLDDNTTMSVASANLSSGSNLNLFLTTNTSQYGQINASGTASVAGANVGVYLDPITFSGTLATTFTYNNVVTGSTVGGTFGSVNLLQTPSPLFSVTGIYSATSAGVQVTRNAFSTLGGNGSNQGNAGDGLEEIFTNGTTDPDLIDLFNVIGSAPAGTVPAIYAAIVGAENSENTGAGLRTDDPWKQSVAERVNAARTTGCTVTGDSWCLRRYAQATTNGGPVMSDVQGDPTAFDWLETGIRDEGSTSFWARGIGAWGETKGDIEGPGSTQWTGGLIGGVDRVINSLFLAGVAAQYVETSVDYDASPNKSSIQSGQFGAYVSYGGAEAYVNGNVSVIGSEAKANRYMNIGLLSYNVNSTARSWALTASVEGGTIMEFDGYRFEPSLALNYQGAHPLDFDEHGGGGLSLLVRPEDSDSLRSILSARMSRVFDLGDRKLVPQIRIDWRHEMLDRRQEFSAAFAGAPSVFFDVKGATYARDTFSTGASVTMPITGNVTGYVDAQGAFSEDSTSVMVSLGGRATW